MVPYTVRDNVKFVPLFYFEGETDHLKLKSDQVDGWDLAYLKFCCKVQGIRNELFAADVCRVVALDEIKGHFPPGTTFEDYWPAKGSIEPVMAQRNPAGNWTQKPPSSVSQNSNSSAVRHHQQQQQQHQQHQASHHNMAAVAAAASAQPSYAAVAAAAAAAQRSLNSSFNPHMLANNALTQHYLSQLQQQSQLAQLAAFGHGRAPAQTKQFPGKLTQIKEFPMERTSQPPYKLQKALIDQKIVPCINVRPYVFHDLMMTLPDFIKHFCPDLTIETVKTILQTSMNIVFYKGNR